MYEIERMNITIDLAEEALTKGEMPISACVFFDSILDLYDEYSDNGVNG